MSALACTSTSKHCFHLIECEHYYNTNLLQSPFVKVPIISQQGFCSPIWDPVLETFFAYSLTCVWVPKKAVLLFRQLELLHESMQS